MNRDYEWFIKENLSKFAGKWIAIYNSKVVESDNNLLKLNQKLHKKNLINAFITKISDKFRVL